MAERPGAQRAVSRDLAVDDVGQGEGREHHRLDEEPGDGVDLGRLAQQAVGAERPGEHERHRGGDARPNREPQHAEGRERDGHGL